MWKIYNNCLILISGIGVLLLLASRIYRKKSEGENKMKLEFMDLDTYLESTTTIEQVLRTKGTVDTKLLHLWDTEIYSYVKEFENKNKNESALLTLNAHSLYLSASRAAISGQSSSVYPLLRTAYESAIYALLIAMDDELSEIWVNRHSNEKAFKENRKAFSPAMKKLGKILELYDTNISEGTKYKKIILNMYEALIDYGAHPNPKTVMNNTSKTLTTEGVIQRYEYLSSYNSEMVRGICACSDCAACICVIMHLHKINDFENPEVNLDEKFLPLFLENNAYLDKINGSLIGFENRLHKKFND